MDKSDESNNDCEDVEDTNDNNNEEILVNYAEDQLNNVVNFTESTQLTPEKTNEGLSHTKFSDKLMESFGKILQNDGSPMENNLMLNNDEDILLDISRTKMIDAHKSVIEEIEKSGIENSEIENLDQSSNDNIDFTPELQDFSQDNFVEEKIKIF